MHIIDLRPEPPGSGSVIARFDVQLTSDCRLYNIKLVRRPHGALRVFAPSAFGTNVATFAPELGAVMARMAGDALREKTVSDQHAA